MRRPRKSRRRLPPRTTDFPVIDLVSRVRFRGSAGAPSFALSGRHITEAARPEAVRNPTSTASAAAFRACALSLGDHHRLPRRPHSGPLRSPTPTMPPCSSVLPSLEATAPATDDVADAVARQLRRRSSTSINALHRQRCALPSMPFIPRVGVGGCARTPHRPECRLRTMSSVYRPLPVVNNACPLCA